MKLFELGKVREITLEIVGVEEEQTTPNVTGLEEGQTAVYRNLTLRPYAEDKRYMPEGNDIRKPFFAIKNAEGEYIQGRDKTLLAVIDEDENAAEGKLIKAEMANLHFSVPHYVVQKDDKGKFVRRMQNDGKTPMVVSDRVLVRRIGDSGSFDRDADAYVRSITKQEAAGGGFMQPVTLNASNEYVIKGSEKVVGQAPAEVDELDMSNM